MRVHRVRDEALIRERVGEAHVRKVLAHARRHAQHLVAAHACVAMGAFDRRRRDGVLSTTDHGHRFETELRHVHLELI